jgi:hypothetical protein
LQTRLVAIGGLVAQTARPVVGMIANLCPAWVNGPV